MELDESIRTLDRRDEFPRGGSSLLWAFDHESNVRRRALDHLEREGFYVRMVRMGFDVIRRARRLSPSSIILETMSVRGTALEVCRGIRQLQTLGSTPVVILSAGACQEDRALAVESGADDCITEPWSGREVVARLRAVLRRFARSQFRSPSGPENPPYPYDMWPPMSSTLKVGDIEIDASGMRVAVRGSVVETTHLEFRLLYYFLHNQGRVFTRDQLLNAVWGADFVELRSVDACIRRLRRKIEPHPIRPTYLRTVRGAGYCFKANVSGTREATV